MKEQAIIKLNKVTKTFGEYTLFSDVSFEIKKGEFIVFSGVSGCGKTTMLNMIGGLEKLTSGAIYVDGEDISKRKNHLDYFRNKVGFLFQNFALVDNKTVRQNLNMVKGSTRTELNLEEALGKVGLIDKCDSYVYSLSGGEQQRVALARLMLKKCDIILADEPTGSLNKNNGKRVMDILCDMNKNGKTVIMVTHDESLKSIGSRVINL